jgi:hypothetical protein
MTNVNKNKNFYLAVIGACIVISGCAAPKTRNEVEAFALKNKGVVDTSKLREFCDCLTDGFHSSHSALTNFSTQERRRANVTRVENYAGTTILLVSADVFDDGKTAIYESSDAAFINVSGELETFSACVKTFGSEIK